VYAPPEEFAEPTPQPSAVRAGPKAGYPTFPDQPVGLEAAYSYYEYNILPWRAAVSASLNFPALEVCSTIGSIAPVRGAFLDVPRELLRTTIKRGMPAEPADFQVQTVGTAAILLAETGAPADHQLLFGGFGITVLDSVLCLSDSMIGHVAPHVDAPFYAAESLVISTTLPLHFLRAARAVRARSRCAASSSDTGGWLATVSLVRAALARFSWMRRVRSS
jgi:hypothetical protein